MKRVIVITGTPASGKSTLARRLAKTLGNSELIEANEIVKDLHLYRKRSPEGEIIADMKELRNELERRIRNSKTGFVIIEGHLLCDIKIRGAVAIVIREHLKALLGRMKKRGYSAKKIEDNIVSEAIDYCGVNSLANYGSVNEIMGGGKALDRIIGIIKGGEKGDEIDVLGELNGMARLLGKKVI